MLIKTSKRLQTMLGDSFYLAQVAQQVTNKVIIVAGVYFMGESVKILNQDKIVLMVDDIATCPMVNMISVDKVQEMRAHYPELAVVSYINSSAEIKSHCDVCVTSSNALRIVEKLDEKIIFFVPDGNLGRYIADRVEDKRFILNDGCCPVHDRISKKMVLELKKRYPNAKILVHPECKQEVIEIADYVGSTSGIIETATKGGNEFIIVTEIGIETKLRGLCPTTKFYFISDFICHDMKRLTLEKLKDTLRYHQNEVFVDEEVAKKALLPLERMLKLGANG